MKTTVTRKKDINNDWHLLDASTESLGRIATKASSLLIGKHRVNYSPNLVMGDKVIIINSDKLQLTGKKLQDKMYYRHSGFAGGFKQRNAEYYMDKDSTFIVYEAVKGMLPKNKLRDKRLKNLYIYKDAKHPHQAHIN